jgi:predicted ester cyclase
MGSEPKTKRELAELRERQRVADEETAQTVIRTIPELLQSEPAFKEVLTEIRVTIKGHIVEGDRVVSRWLLDGTHNGQFEGFAPIGREITIHGATVSAFRDGEVVHLDTFWDLPGLLKQISAQ